jgi:Cu(I)/Ag(I) efflux system membrane fusion protein
MTILQKPWIRTLTLLIAVIAAFLLGLSFRGQPSSNSQSDQTNTIAEDILWTCSMHPQIQLPEPGSCPLCGMDLIAIESDDNAEETGVATLTLSQSAQKRAEIETIAVRRKDVDHEIRMIGKLEVDETRVRDITAWVSGRIDRLYVDYTGVAIRSGQKLFDLYSPDLYSAQTELLQAIAMVEDLGQSDFESTRASADRTVAAARERLGLWGLTQRQIAEIESRGSATDLTTITAPTSGIVLEKNVVEGEYVKTGARVFSIADLSTLWLKLDAYESDLAWLQTAQTVDFETDAFPGEIFSGTVTFVDPVLTERSRTVKVRVNVPNPDGRLVPGLFARATLRTAVDSGGQRESGTESPLVIPTTAPLLTGARAVVYVADPDEPGRYEGREVVLGPRAGDFYVVRSGVTEGEQVVTNGAFKIDSALQIRAKRSMMSPREEREPADHPTTTGREVADAGDRVEIPPQSRLPFDDLLSVYYEIADALSHDDFEAARTATAKFPAAVLDVESGSLPSANRDTWANVQAQLEKDAATVLAAETIKLARNAFFDLSNHLIAAVRTFAATGRQSAMIFHCPMAMGGDGADWLQPKPGTENPYYGSMMFKCGSQKETLIAGTASPTTP